MRTEVGGGGAEGLVVEAGIRVVNGSRSGGHQCVQEVGWGRRTGPLDVFGEIGDSLAGTE